MAIWLAKKERPICKCYSLLPDFDKFKAELVKVPAGQLRS